MELDSFPFIHFISVMSEYKNEKIVCSTPSWICTKGKVLIYFREFVSKHFHHSLFLPYYAYCRILYIPDFQWFIKRIRNNLQTFLFIIWLFLIHISFGYPALKSYHIIQSSTNIARALAISSLIILMKRSCCNFQEILTLPNKMTCAFHYFLLCKYEVNSLRVYVWTNERISCIQDAIFHKYLFSKRL